MFEKETVSFLNINVSKLTTTTIGYFSVPKQQNA